MWYTDWQQPLSHANEGGRGLYSLLISADRSESETNDNGTVWDDLVTLVYSGATVCTISFTYIPADHLDSVSTGELCEHKTDCKHLELRKTQHERQNREIKCRRRMQRGVFPMPLCACPHHVMQSTDRPVPLISGSQVSHVNRKLFGKC